MRSSITNGLYKADYWFQIVLMVIDSVLIITYLFDRSMIFHLLLWQLLIGVYQYLISALPNMIGTNRLSNLWKFRLSHLVMSTVYLVVLFLVIFPYLNRADHEINWLMLVILIPQVLAYLYFAVTYMGYQERQNSVRSLLW